MLLEFTWHLQSSTRYDNDGNITGVYAGTPSDSLLFDLRLDSSSNAYQYSVQKYIASSFDTFNFTLNQTVATNQKVNFLTCAQPWNSGYSDTVKVLPVVDVWHWKYLVFKIGKPNNSAWKVTK